MDLFSTAFSTLSSIYSAATQLKEIYEQVKANKQQSKTLNQRVQLIIPHIHSLEEQLKLKFKQGKSSVNDSTLVGQLERLLHTLESCVKLVDKFTAAHWLKRLWNKSDYTKQFADLNSELSLLSTDLQLGLSIKSVFDHEADVRDQHADLSELLAGQEEILSGQRELHDHLLLGLSLDRQVLDGQQQLQGHLKLTAEQQRKQAEAELVSRRRFQNEIIKKLEQLQSPTHSSTSGPTSPISPKDLVLLIDYTDLRFSSEPVGSGGFGDVYLGQWISRDLDVAIKKLRVSALSKTALAEFNAEVELLASIPRHDHVVGLLGICIDQSKQIYLMVLDWMEQGSLFEYLRRSTLPDATPLAFEKKINLMLQCAKAVNHLHLLRRPIIHGDIKSMNFLLNSHGDIKIGDFGLSRVRTESMSQSKLSQQYQTSGGSIQYQAPELLDGFESPTKQSDIYALTIVLWEILTCKIPYGGIAPERIQLMIPSGKRLPIPIDPNLSDEMNAKLKSLIEHGWHQNPLQRPTAQQLIQDIKIIMVQLIGRSTEQEQKLKAEMEAEKARLQVEAAAEHQRQVEAEAAREAARRKLEADLKAAADKEAQRLADERAAEKLRLAAQDAEREAKRQRLAIEAAVKVPTVNSSSSSSTKSLKIDEAMKGGSSLIASLITTQYHLAQKLQGWLQTTGTSLSHAKLIFQASVNGWTKDDFVRSCVGYSNTLILVKVAKNDYLFGAYIAPEMTKQEGGVPDPTGQSFLFSLINSANYPIRLALDDQCTPIDLSFNKNGRNVVGLGRDSEYQYAFNIMLYFHGPANSSSGNLSGSHDNRGNWSFAYQLDNDSQNLAPKGFDLHENIFGGDCRFGASEIEVYQLVSNTLSKPTISSTPPSSVIISPPAIPTSNHSLSPHVVSTSSSSSMIKSNESKRMGSLITSLKHELSQKLEGWLKPTGMSLVNSTLVYEASSHGWKFDDFFRECLGKSHLLFLVKVKDNGYVFGAYIAPKLEKVGVSDRAGHSFLFSLINQHDHPFRLDLYNSSSAIDIRDGCVEFGRYEEKNQISMNFTLWFEGKPANLVGGNRSFLLNDSHCGYQLDEKSKRTMPQDMALNTPLFSGSTLFSASEIKVYQLS